MPIEVSLRGSFVSYTKLYCVLLLPSLLIYICSHLGYISYGNMEVTSLLKATKVMECVNSWSLALIQCQQESPIGGAMKKETIQCKQPNYDKAQL